MAEHPQVLVRPLSDAVDGKPDSDRAWACALLAERWGSTVMITCGVPHDLAALPGLVAWVGGERAGLLIYRLDGPDCEVMSLDSVIGGVGIGTALLAAVQTIARAEGCRRVWLITTNDNTPALRFYQRRGFTLAAFHRQSLDAARALKPEIPLIGLEGIPLRDEIELENLI